MATKRKKTRGRKGKKKLNTRLLAIVGLSLVMVGGVGAGLLYLKIKGSVGRNLAAGQALLDEGKHEKALRAIGKVLYRETGNQDAHNLRIKIYRDMIPETPERARSLYRDYVVALAQHAQFTSGNEELAFRSLDECWEAAMNTDSDAYWALLESQAEEQRKRFQSGTPVYNRATLLLGMAKMRLGQANFLGDVDATGHVRFPGEAELSEYVELEPGSDEGLARLAFGRMAVARRLGLEGRVQQEAHNLAMAQGTYDEAIAANPEGIETLLAVVRHMYVHELVAELRGELDEDVVGSKLDELEAQLTRTEARIASGVGVQRHQVLELARYLALIDLETGHERAAAMFKKWLEKHPDDLNAKVLLAAELVETKRYEEADTLLAEVLNSPQLPVSIASQRQRGDQLAAAVTRFEINEQLRESLDAAEATARAEELRDRVRDLLGGSSDSPLVLRLDGRIAHAEGRHAHAVKAFERSLDLGGTLDAESLRKSAQSLERIGQAGLAVQRLEQAVRDEPRSVRNRMLLAQLHARLRNYEAAAELLATIPAGVRAKNPDIAKFEEGLRLTSLSAQDRETQLAGDSDAVLQAISKADQLEVDGKLSEAKDLLAGLMGDFPDDVRLLVAIAQVDARLGDTESAQVTMDRALALQPDNQRLRQLAMVMANADPVDLAKAAVAEQYPPGDTHDIALFISLESLASRSESQAESLAERNPERSAKLLETASRAREEAAPLAQLVQDSVESSAEAFAYHFEQLLQRGAFAQAEAMLPAARDGDFDSAGGNLAEARLLLAMGSAAESGTEARTELLKRAAATARRATDVSPWRNMTWETLGQAMRELEEWDEARLAYEELVRRNPSDTRGVTELARLHLLEGGDPTRAVAVLADAANRRPGNRELRESWLQLEALHGTPGLALRERLLEWKRNPNDRNAALWYAGMLAALPAEYGYDLDDNGNPRVSGRQWLGMTGEQQQQRLTQLKDSWLKRIGVIAEQLRTQPDATLREAIQHATILREIGQRDAMMVVLREYLAAQRDEDTILQQALQVGRFLLDSDRFWEASQLLEEYREVQSPVAMEIDSALGQMMHRAGLWEDALRYLTTASEVTGALGLRMREIDCLLQLQRLDEAEAAIQQLLQTNPDEYQLALLEAGLHSTRGSVAEAAGDTAAALAARDAFRGSLERASSLDPTRPGPYVDLVKSLVLEYHRTLDRVKLEQAMRYLDAAAEIGESSEELVIQRADVSEALGDPRRAVLDLEAFLRRSPDARRVRSRLASAYVTAGTPTRAIDTLQQAITLEPRDPYWYGLLGDYYAQSGDDLAGATRNYVEAWKIEPTRRRLTALADATVTSDPWDYEAFLEAVKLHPKQLQDDPRASGLLARAEHGLGLEARSKETLRDAYHVYRSAIDRGLMPPMHLAGWYRDLYVLFPEGDVSEPLAMVEAVTKGEPTTWDKRGLAQFHVLRGGDELAVAEEIQREVTAESDPEFVVADLRQLGGIQLQAGMNAKARDTFKRLVELQPDDPIALNNYAYLLATVENDAAAAESYALRAIAMAPRQSVILDTMTTIQQALGKHEAALSSCLARLAIEPNNGPLLRRIAMILSEDLDRPAEAVPYVTQALSLDPRGAAALDSAGWVAWRAGDQSKGRDLVGQSLRRQPTALAHLHMAQMLHSGGDRTAAREHLQQADHLATDDSTRDRVEAMRAHLDAEG